MSKFKTALTRKFGPLPAWAWFGIFAVGVYYYRAKLSGSASTQSGTGTGSVAPTGLQALAPDQSYYDPATPGQFFTTPGEPAPGSNTTTTKKKGKTKRSKAHVPKRRKRKTTSEHKTGRKFKVPGRRDKGGTAHKTHRPRHRPDRDIDRRRHRPKTTVPQPVKARPTGGASIAPPRQLTPAPKPTTARAPTNRPPRHSPPRRVK